MHKNFTKALYTCFVLAFAFLYANQALAQEITVSGKVTSVSDNEALPGVNILIQGTTQGTSTDINGKYSLSAASNDTLVFSYIGYQTKHVPINGRTTINVSLSSRTIGGQELVVVGYGTQRSSDLSSSVSSVNTDQIQKNSVLPNAASALEGTTAGVSVTPSSGEPGSGINIRIRGSNSFGNNSPLVIIDGVPGNMDDVNPEDIKSMQVLKDAAAAAIYGSRAANGVVIVQTKSGQAGKINVNIKSSFGVQQPRNFISVANTRQYAEIDNKLHKSAGLPVFDALKNPSSLGAGTDWQNTVYNDAPIWKTYMGITGGDENSSYSISGSFNKQQGIAEATWYRKATLHYRGQQDVGNFTFGESIFWNDNNRRTLPYGGDKPLIQQTILAQPMIPVHDSTNIGGYGGPPSYLATQAFNPLGLLELQKNTNHTNSLNMKVNAQYDFLNAFTYKINAGYNVNDGYYQGYTPQYFFSNQRQNIRASLSETRSRTHHWLLENTLHYKQQFGKHNISALAGFTAEENHYRETTGSKTGFPNNNLEVLDASTGYSINSGGNDYRWDMISLLGRVIYNYNNRYYLTANVRRDGSSRFGTVNRYGVFPSASVAWRLSNEKFFSPLKSVISNFKLRGSYGVLGNQPSATYSYIPTINYSTHLGYLYGGGFESGAAIQSFANPAVKWETTKDLDVGVNIDFLNNFTFEGDYYLNKTNNVLLRVPIPPSTGTSTPPLVNTGKLQNQGVELSLTYNSSSSREFNYSITGNVSTVRNKVLKLGYEGQVIYGDSPHRASTGPVSAAKVGYPIGAFFMKQADGLFQSQEEVNNYTHKGNLIQPNAKPGDVRYVDVNNDGQINSMDTKYSGSPFPTFSYGLNFSANYKNFDFTLFLQGTYGNKMFDTNTWITNRGTLDYNFHTDMLNAWTPQNTNTDVPRLTFNDPNHNSDPSTRFLYDASYLRFKTVQLGYTLPSESLSQLGVNNLRIFVNARNLWTITKYPGYDPSYTADGLLNRGLDQGLYPISRVISGGIDIKF